ncbi:MAG: hypothetical protein V1867_01825 [Candidatus Falkowbacteria bacterium]
MNLEQPRQQNILSNIFGHDQDALAKKIKSALDEEARGGYKQGTSGFIKSIIGSVKLSGDEYARCKKEINMEISRLEKSAAEKSIRRDDAYRRDMKDRAEAEWRRSSGIYDPSLEELKQD